MESELEVIDAFIDGERVDTDALKAVLAQPEGRDYFVDAWLLREAVQQDGESAIPAPQIRAAVASASPSVARWLVPAALAAGIAGGYFAGYQSTTVRQPASAPAPQTSVASVPTTTPTPAVFPVPPATRVIQLEFRPETTDNKSGGN